MAEYTPDPSVVERSSSYDLNHIDTRSQAVFVRAKRDVVIWNGGDEQRLDAGSIVKLVSTSNAGFRGIVVHVKDLTDRHWYDVSGGAFEVV